MYKQFFQLRHAPFSIAPDPHYLFMSERHREALAHLLFGEVRHDGHAGADDGAVIVQRHQNPPLKSEPMPLPPGMAARVDRYLNLILEVAA